MLNLALALGEGSLQTPACGLMPTQPAGTIINGKEAFEGQFPWQVMLNHGGSLCGGSIISEDWGITAAHCINRYTKSSINVYVGYHHRGYEREGKTTVSH